jgi:hypothetical protein
MAQTLNKIFMEKLRQSPKEEIEITKFKKAPNRGRPPRSTKKLLPELNKTAAGKKLLLL